MFMPIRERWPMFSRSGSSLDHYREVLRIIKGLIRDLRGKLRPSCNGPYFIRDVILESTTWLMDLDGNQFLEPTNVDQLKKYYV